MYIRNATTRVSIGPVIKIADGEVQTAGVSVRLLQEGQAAAAGAGTVAYQDGVVVYTPDAGEMNHVSVVLIAHKADCIPATVTITTSAGDPHPIVNHADYGNAKLVRSTTPANTLDISATGEAGLDFANIKNATGPHTLTNITIPTVTTVGTCTTNTDMRGTDNAALATVCTETRLAELDAANLPTDIAAIPTNPMLDTENGSSFTSLPAVTLANGAHGGAAATMQLGGAGGLTATVTGNVTGSVGSVTTGVTITGTMQTLDGLSGKVLSYLQLMARKDAAVATDCAAELAEINANMGSGAGAYDNASDSIEALRDRGDAAWLTATGFSTHSAADVKTAIEAEGSSIAQILEDSNELQTNQDNWLTATGFSTFDASSDKVYLGNGAHGGAAASITLADYSDFQGAAGDPWATALPGAYGAGTAGKLLADAGAAGDPWATALPGSYGAGTAGKLIGDNINAPIATIDTVVDAIKAKTDNLPANPAAVGSEMALDDGAITAAKIGAAALNGKGDWSTHTANNVRDAILTDATRFAGANIDTAVSTRSSHSANNVRDAILTDATRFAGASIDAAISTRSSHTPANVKTAIETGGSHLDLIKTKTDNLPLAPAAQAKLDDVEGRLTAARAGYLDKLNIGAETLANTGNANDFKATGFSTHTAADVKTAVEAAGSHLALIKAVTDAMTAGSAAKLAVSAGTMITGEAQAGTLTTTEMTTDLTITVDDQLKGRILIFAINTTTAALRGQATDITASVPAGGKLTFTALTTAPVAGDTFVIV